MLNLLFWAIGVDGLPAQIIAGTLAVLFAAWGAVMLIRIAELGVANAQSLGQRLRSGQRRRRKRRRK